MAITSGRGFPVLLDITRLTSRVGRGPLTGIDRVELAYLNWCLNTDEPLWGFAKTAGGYVLLNRDGLLEFRARFSGLVPWGARDLRARIGIKTPPPRGAAESDLRRLACGTATRRALPGLFNELNPQQIVYLNTGHSNLSEHLLTTLRASGHRIATFLHDLIPTQFPQFQRAGTVDRFERLVSCAFSQSDLVITNSETTKAELVEERDRQGQGVRIISAHLGIEVETTGSLDITQNRPYFVALGTIEPRKNHALLLKVWQNFYETLAPSDIPRLVIVGQRGWVDQGVITQIETLSDTGHLLERNNLNDNDLWPLLSGAHALLVPSFAEGFGLPSLEAAALGTPLICGELAIHKELLGSYPVYLNLDDIYLWQNAIIEHSQEKRQDLRASCAQNRPQIPSWSKHFEAVNAAIMDLR